MVASVTVATLRDRIYNLNDLSGSQWPATAMVNAHIRRHLSNVYQVLVTANEQFFVTSARVTLAAAASTINLASTGVLAASVQLLRVSRIFYDSSDTTYELVPFHPANYSSYSTGSNSPEYLQWHLRGNTLVFSQPTNTAAVLRLWYIPAFNDAVASATALGWVVPVSWMDAVVYGVAADLAAAQEEDPSYWLGRYRDQERRIIEECERLQGHAMVVQDAYRRWSY